jgi:hypothetical protein
MVFSWGWVTILSCTCMLNSLTCNQPSAPCWLAAFATCINLLHARKLPSTYLAGDVFLLLLAASNNHKSMMYCFENYQLLQGQHDWQPV